MTYYDLTREQQVQLLHLAAKQFLCDSHSYTMEQQMDSLMQAGCDDIPDGVEPWLVFEGLTSDELYDLIEDFAQSLVKLFYPKVKEILKE